MLPAATPVTTPLPLTTHAQHCAEFELFPEVQTPPGVACDKLVVEPSQTVVLPVIAASGAAVLIVTGVLTELVQPLEFV